MVDGELASGVQCSGAAQPERALDPTYKPKVWPQTLPQNP